MNWRGTLFEVAVIAIGTLIFYMGVQQLLSPEHSLSRAPWYLPSWIYDSFGTIGVAVTNLVLGGHVFALGIYALVISARKNDGQDGKAAERGPALSSQENTVFGVPNLEVVIPQTLLERCWDGLFASSVFIGLLVAWGAKLYPYVVSLEDFRTIGDSGAIMYLLSLLASIVILLVCGQFLAESVKGLPILVANRAGLDHFKFGHIPWPAVKDIGVVDVGTRAPSLELVVFVPESLYRERLKGHFLDRIRIAYMNWLSGNWMRGKGAILTIASEFFGRQRPYLRNGIAMPPEALANLARLLLETRPPKHDLANDLPVASEAS